MRHIRFVIYQYAKLVQSYARNFCTVTGMGAER